MLLLNIIFLIIYLYLSCFKSKTFQNLLEFFKPLEFPPSLESNVYLKLWVIKPKRSGCWKIKGKEKKSRRQIAPFLFFFGQRKKERLSRSLLKEEEEREKKRYKKKDLMQCNDDDIISFIFLFCEIFFFRKEMYT